MDRLSPSTRPVSGGAVALSAALLVLVFFAAPGCGSGSSSGAASGTGSRPQPQPSPGSGSINPPQTTHLVIEQDDMLSSRGSNRATAYGMSNKIITHGDLCFVAWLDAPSEIMVRTLDRSTGRWSQAVRVGTGTDNHGGPALAIDSTGVLHMVYGPHHGPFQYSRSNRPLDASSWDHLGTFGTLGTYPSLVIDANDTLHVAYRGGASPRKVIYQHRPKGGAWSSPQVVLDPRPDTGYTQYTNALAVDRAGRLHLAFYLGTTSGGRTSGKGLGYLYSDDGGTSWKTFTGRAVTLPATRQSQDVFFHWDPGADMRLGSMVLDPNGAPWLLAQHDIRLPSTGRALTLWRLEQGVWRSIDLLPVLSAYLPNRGPARGLPGTLTFDAQGRLYLALAVSADPGVWGDPSCEVVVLSSRDRGQSFELLPISNTGGAIAGWLTSIERPSGANALAGPPVLLYTIGHPKTDPSTVRCVRLGWR